MPSIETFGLWTNKGGVGKTTLSFHLSNLYAHLHPEKCVLLVDMCPQANLSSTVLTYGTDSGAEVVKNLQAGNAINKRNLVLPAMHVPRTVAGYLHTVLGRANSLTGPKNSDFIVRVADVNDRCPPNVYLLCGDGRMDDMCGRLRMPMDLVDGFEDGFRTTLSKLRDMFKALQSEVNSRLQGMDITVFIDTNPAFTEYTQLALCSMDKLVVPINADDFSLQAVQYMFTRVWNLCEPSDNFSQTVRKGAFAVKAAERAAELLPKLAAVVHNRHSVRATRTTRAFQHLADTATGSLYAAFQEANPQGGSGHVFVDKGHPDKAQFEMLYAGTMREMFSAGVGAAHTGIPLHCVLDNQSVITDAFNNKKIVSYKAVLSLVADLVKLLSLLLDDHDLSRLSNQGTVNLYEILRITPLGDRSALKRLLKWTARKRAYEQCMAAVENREPAEVSDGEEDNDYNDNAPNANANNGGAAGEGAAAGAAAVGAAAGGGAAAGAAAGGAAGGGGAAAGGGVAAAAGPAAAASGAGPSNANGAHGAAAAGVATPANRGRGSKRRRAS